MPSFQKKSYKLKLDSIKAWQKALPMWTWGRFERTRKIVNDNYGKIDLAIMTDLISDRYCMKKKQRVDWNDKDAATIADMWAKGHVLAKKVKYYKSSRVGDIAYSGATIWSLVMRPLSGDVEIAMSGEVPAQKGGFKHINLFEELKAH